VYIRKQAPDLRDVIPFKFTQDGDWIVYQDVDTNGKDALFRVRTTGGEPQRLGDYPTNSSNSYLNVSVDGRHFLVEATANNPTSAEGLQSDYWILQNFVPVATTPKQ
jgi:Tol biopolymer transport system component